MASVYTMLNQFRKWARSPRIWMVFLLFAIFVSTNFVESIRAFCVQHDAKSTVWLLPILLTKLNQRLWVMLLPILLFCDAPFLDEHQPFQIIRIGRMRWAAGQILYIFAASAIFFIACFIICVVLMMPHIEFTLEWGKVLKTLTQLHITSELQMDPIPMAILSNYTPLQATLFSAGGTWIATSFLGLTMFLCNLWARREVGMLVAGCFVGLSHFTQMMAMGNRTWYRARYVSPVSWVDLLGIGRGDAESPAWVYVWIAGAILLLVLVIGILLSVRRKSIDVVSWN